MPPMSETTPERLVLLVDDDESLLDLMEHVVKKEGLRTERAVDGPEALRKARALRPDAIVLDMMLPGLGGREVARGLQDAGCVGIPIVVVTGRQMNPGEIESLRREPNVREFMEKPVRPAVLAATLRRLLGGGSPGERGG